MLSDLLAAYPDLNSSRVAILGIGNELNSDDAAGVLAARLLMKRLAEKQSGNGRCLILEAGLAPEAFTGPLRRFKPDQVILLDAAELGERPGAVRCFDWAQAEGLSASTHTLPPFVLAKFLIQELGCNVILIGIQPKTLLFDGQMSYEVATAVNHVVNQLVESLF